MPTPLKTNVYIDGFNFYFGAVRGTPYKWLDLAKLCAFMLPHNIIHQIKYFSARVSARPNDPDQPIRQQIYWRALRTIPNLTIVEGHFLTHEVMMPLAGCPLGEKPKYVKVVKTEEKGSDVNLATHLLHGAYRSDYDVAVVVSNDSDLLEPIKIAKNFLGKTIGILNPHKHPSVVLHREATFFKTIRKGVLAKCQFPRTLKDAHGTIRIPRSW